MNAMIRYIYYMYLCYICLSGLCVIGNVANSAIKGAVVRAFDLDNHRRKKKHVKHGEDEILEAELISVETIG